MNGLYIMLLGLLSSVYCFPNGGTCIVVTWCPFIFKNAHSPPTIRVFSPISLFNNLQLSISFCLFIPTAPRVACNSMTPVHLAQRQTDPSPYVIAVDKSAVRSLSSANAEEESVFNRANAITGTCRISWLFNWKADAQCQCIFIWTVTLFSPSGEEFKGFFLQARSGSESVGTFSDPSNGNGKLMNCQSSREVNVKM